MIIATKNPYEEKRKKISKIKLLWDIKLPKRYYLFCGEEVQLRQKSWLGIECVADINLIKDIIIVNFKYNEDYQKLKKYFEDSKTKFKLLGENYY